MGIQDDIFDVSAHLEENCPGYINEAYDRIVERFADLERQNDKWGALLNAIENGAKAASIIENGKWREM